MSDADPTEAPEASKTADDHGSPAKAAPARPAAPLARRRWVVGLLSGLHAALLAWAAATLPWRSWTLFAAASAALAALHLATLALMLLPHRLALRAWRITSIASLIYLAYLTYGVASSALYIASLNRGLGTGIAAGLGAVWAVAALFTLPLACWGIAATGGVRPRKETLAALAASTLAVALGLGWQHRVAKADPLSLPGGSVERTAAVLTDALAGVASRPAPPRNAPSLHTAAPAACPAPPAPGRVSVLLTYLATQDNPARPAAVTRCVQLAEGEDLTAALRPAVAEALRGPVKIDVLSAAQPLRSPGKGAEGFALRPGLDGVCLAERCLAPWQLIALDAFNAQGVEQIRDLRYGFAPARIRKVLGESPPREELDGLVRVETSSYLLDAAGELHILSRIGQPARLLAPETLAEASAAAQGYIVKAQRNDGMFRYMVDPFTGRASFEGFSVARQAGTTLALCELGEPGAVRDVVRRSLAMLATLEQPVGGAPPEKPMGALIFPAGAREPVARLNPTALSLIALLSCRSLAGPEQDARIGRLARMALAAQRPDGGFAPEVDMARGVLVPGPGTLYESGQAMFALILLEAQAAREPKPEWPAAADVRAAVERGMEYFATRYWDHFASDFLYIEENWHCLAARAALGHHRHDGYERFCIDYVAFKSRIILDEESRVQDDFVGGYGFGNILPPHNTGTAGFGEALAAAMAIKAARGEDLSKDRARMEKALSFLLRQQWTPVNCFACARNVRIEGAWSEHMASPQIRIDYVQHAWAALGHGGRVLGLLPKPGDAGEG